MKKSFFVLFFIGVLFLSGALATTYTVTNCADSGVGSLRQAITDVSANGGPDVITFNISTEVGYDATFGGFTTEAGVSWWQIIPTTTLPWLNGAGANGSELRGSSQTAFAGFSYPPGPRIEVRGAAGTNYEYGVGLFSASNCTVEGLAINSFGSITVGEGNGIKFRGDEACQFNQIRNCYIGTDILGTNPRPNQAYGIYLFYGPDWNLIGGTTAEGNVISANGGSGIYVDGYEESVAKVTENNRISGNIIGLDRTGTVARGNGSYGIIADHAVLTRIGGASANLRNVISGNTGGGINILSASAEVKGNIIGLNAAGTDGFADVAAGIFVQSDYNIIGGDTPAERNIISHNSTHGIDISDGCSNEVVGNYIGTDLTGAVDQGNTTNGIRLNFASRHNHVRNNLISGNNGAGVYFKGRTQTLTDQCTYNVLTGNIIGLDASGTAPLGNTQAGLTLANYSSYNIIGGTSSADRNIISGNGGNGVRLLGPEARFNWFKGNFIGTALGGTVDLGNGSLGLYLDPLANNDYNIIGGTGTGEGNVISGNNLAGAAIGSNSNTFAGNYLGTTVNGADPLPNANLNLLLLAGARNNTIGPDNHFAYGPTDGLQLSGEATNANRITRNSIFGNGTLGIRLFDGGNSREAAPVIWSADTAATVGTAAAYSLVELFTAAPTGELAAQGQGKMFLSTTEADALGAWTATTSGLSGGELVCATATDRAGNTSEFSFLFTVGTSTTTTTTTITPGSTTTTSTLPIAEDKFISEVRLRSIPRVAGVPASLNLTFNAREAGTATYVIDDGLAPRTILKTGTIPFSAGMNALSLAAVSSLGRDLPAGPVRISVIYKGQVTSAKGFVIK